MAHVTLRDINLIVLLGVLWGVSFMAIKAGLDSFDPIWFAAVRYDIAGIAMLLVALPAGLRRLMPVGRRQWTAMLVSAALNVMGYHAFLFWGQQFTTSAIGAVIIGMIPVTAMAFSRLFLPGERVGPWGLLGLTSGLLGLALLVGLKPGALLDARGIGELAIIGAVLSWAGGIVVIKRLAHGMPTVPFTVGQMLLGALMLHALSLGLEGPSPRSEWTLASTSAMLYLALVASALGFFLYFNVLERVGPVRTSLVSYVAPAFAALAGYVFLAEHLEPRAVAAFALIALGFRLVVAPVGTRARAAAHDRTGRAGPGETDGPSAGGAPSPNTERRDPQPPARVRVVRWGDGAPRRP